MLLLENVVFVSISICPFQSLNSANDSQTRTCCSNGLTIHRVEEELLTLNVDAVVGGEVLMKQEPGLVFLPADRTRQLRTFLRTQWRLLIVPLPHVTVQT